jgi:flagellin-like protein
MKANQRFVNDDDGVSPVIAVILMVAITVVLAATVYLWVSGFGNNTQNVVQAQFAAKAVDLPGGLTATSPSSANVDTDSQDEAIQITYTAGQADLNSNEVYITIDGVKLAPQTSGTNGFVGALTSTAYCTSFPAGVSSTSASGFTWARGSSLYLWYYGAATCGTNAPASMKGTHSLQVVGKNQVILDTTIEVHQ